MNIKVKCRLTLLFSLMVFGGLGMNTQVNAATDDSTTAASQIQSVSKADSSVTVNPAEGTSSNVSADESSDSAAAKIDDSKVNKDSGSSVTTTYGDAKDNQVKANSDSDKDAAKGDSSTDVSDSSTDVTGDSSAQKDSTSDQNAASDSSTSTDDAIDTDTDTADVTEDTDSSKVVKPASDKADVDADKSSTDAQPTTAASDADAPDDSPAVLESLTQDASKSDQAPETLVVPDQPIIESQNVHNDIVGDTFADKVTKSDPKAVKEATAIANNKTKLLTFNAFSDKIYRHVLKTAQKPGTVTTTSGHKVTLTTPVKHVKYTEHDSTGVSETLPVMATLAIIGVAGITFNAFDPLRFLFK